MKHLRQRPLGNPDDYYSRAAHEPSAAVEPPRTCCRCGRVILADAEFQEMGAEIVCAPECRT